MDWFFIMNCVSSTLPRPFLDSSSTLPRPFLDPSSTLPRLFLDSSSTLPRPFLDPSSTLPRLFLDHIFFPYLSCSCLAKALNAKSSKERIYVNSKLYDVFFYVVNNKDLLFGRQRVFQVCFHRLWPKCR